MKKLLLLLLLFAAPSWAAQNYTGNSFTHLSQTYTQLLNATFVPQTNGTVAYCSNCTQTTVCAAGGTGAVGVLVNGTWQCGLGSTISGTVNLNPGTTGQPIGYVNGTTAGPITAVNGDVNGSINVKTHGASGTARTGIDGVTHGNNVFDSATGNFTSADIGKIIAINTANGVAANTTILSINNSTEVVMSAVAGGAGTNLYYLVGLDDHQAVINSANIACTGPNFSNGVFCSAPIYFPPGGYYMGSNKNLVLNPTTIGSGAQFVANLNIQCAGPAGSTGPPLTTIYIDNNSGTGGGIDLFANSNWTMHGCDVRTIGGATGPKALIAWGKTNNCNCDVTHISDNSFTSNSSSLIGLLYTVGGENPDIGTNKMYALSGGADVVLSATNTAGGGITSTQVIDQPGTANVISAAFPVSMTQAKIHNNVLSVNGGSTSGSNAIYLDDNSNTPTGLGYMNTDGVYDNDCQRNGLFDNCVGDGFTGSGAVKTSVVNSFAYIGNYDEAFSFAGGGYSHTFQIGNNFLNASIFGNIDSTTGFIQVSHADGVANSTTTFTSALMTCPSGASGSYVGATIVVFGTGANNIISVPGTYITTCAGGGHTAILSQALQATANTLTYFITSQSSQFYENLSGYVQIASGVGGLSCVNGVGTTVANFAYNSQLSPINCPGSVYANPLLNTTQTAQMPVNNGVGYNVIRYQDYGSPLGNDYQCSNAANGTVLCSIDASGNAVFAATTSPTVTANTSVTTSKDIFNSFLFASRASALTANGQIGYCSDCTIANPCAGAGTGAIAKLLNGVFVCN